MLAHSDPENSADRARYQHAPVARCASPAFWKRWTVSMLAVYPPLVCLVIVSQYVLGWAHPLLSLSIIAFCLTGLSTGLILPFLNRHLHDWLRR